MSLSGEGALMGPFAGSRSDRTSTIAADDGAPLAVEEIEPVDGRARIAVVAVHGFALSRRSWFFQRQELAKAALPGVKHVYYDHRGHGQSAPSDARQSTIEQLALDLHAVLRTVAADTPVVLVGHSMGGMVIMELAQTCPELFAERVRGVGLIATAAGEIGAQGLPRSLLSKYNPLTRGVGELAEWQPGLVEFVRAAGGQLTRAAVRRLAFGSQDVPGELVDFMLEMLRETPVRQLTHFVDTLGSHNRYAALAGLKHTEVVVIGGDSDRLTPFAHAERIAAEVPRAKLVCVEGGGHMVHLEHHALVNRHLAELVRRVR
ncbi:alpha/beta hydrolase [Saccharomonospora xinjiangensis]|uniref:Putative hydrolase or acyltransferase of alpha/beta superfamily n=1 Tax=Saccharomonospora xinjiangensis XJ-54 TaxID=882086 RepID=I0V102_9PSEU|nr:alpha/beta hydrolase [Saccharomonospora xinjiangensis]EID53805.1 putative hydrolase or acyltransferase of alpha/beta superfamily [Saccharomonospora xinjiangensis XJ-54]QBQ58893.1 short chain dehydrogenase [Saccharomonospora xinjiangensis]